MWIQAPLDALQVDLINRAQAGVVPSPTHPLTCPNAKDGQHAFAAGYLGILVAQRRGLVCPTCGHTQSWLSASVLACAQREPLPVTDHQRQRMERARQRAIADFSALVRQGYLSAQSMVESLQRASLPVGGEPSTAAHLPDDLTRAPALAALAA
jgi:hypothetical protein